MSECTGGQQQEVDSSLQAPPAAQKAPHSSVAAASWRLGSVKRFSGRKENQQVQWRTKLSQDVGPKPLRQTSLPLQRFPTHHPLMQKWITIHKPRAVITQGAGPI